MADGGHHEAVVSAAWFAPVVALISSVMTGFILFAAQRLVGKAAWQAAMTAANKDMIDQLQEERSDYIAERTAERLAWAQERSQFTGEIINLTQALESLKSYLRRNGLDIPDTYRAPAELIVIEGDKK
jgi:hypothetical protein